MDLPWKAIIVTAPKPTTANIMKIGLLALISTHELPQWSIPLRLAAVSISRAIIGLQGLTIYLLAI